MRKKMTAQEKRERKERKRIKELNDLIESQYSIISFHRLFEYADDIDYTIRDAEIRAAKEKIAQLEKQL